MPTATAHPNIALIKYWGKRDVGLNLPAVPSLSVTLDGFTTTTSVALDPDAPADRFTLDGAPASALATGRVTRFLDLIDPDRPHCTVISANDFPTAAGLASSSSAFAALALAGAAALGHDLTRAELSVLARRGSGSATRSLWGGWVVWEPGERADGTDSHGVPLAPREHWDVRIVVAMISSGPKPIGSTAGMIRTQETCPLFPGFVASAPADLAQASDAVLRRDLPALGEAMERSTLKMHATMIATVPSVRYWKPATVAALEVVEELRRAGVGAWYTMDAGPNVKVLCAAGDADRVAAALREATDEVTVLGVGGDPVLQR